MGETFDGASPPHIVTVPAEINLQRSDSSAQKHALLMRVLSLKRDANVKIFSDEQAADLVAHAKARRLQILFCISTWGSMALLLVFIVYLFGFS